MLLDALVFFEMSCKGQVGMWCTRKNRLGALNSLTPPKEMPSFLHT